MVKYYGMTQFLSIPIILIIEEDCTFFTWVELSFKNFLITIPFAVLLLLSKPHHQLTRDMASLRVFTVKNHLAYWGLLLISSLGLTVSYIYYFNSDDFVANEDHRYADA
jgi:hypothetical protein